MTRKEFNAKVDELVEHLNFAERQSRIEPYFMGKAFAYWNALQVLGVELVPEIGKKFTQYTVKRVGRTSIRKSI